MSHTVVELRFLAETHLPPPAARSREFLQQLATVIGLHWQVMMETTERTIVDTAIGRCQITVTPVIGVNMRHRMLPVTAPENDTEPPRKCRHHDSELMKPQVSTRRRWRRIWDEPCMIRSIKWNCRRGKQWCLASRDRWRNYITGTLTDGLTQYVGGMAWGRGMQMESNPPESPPLLWGRINVKISVKVSIRRRVVENSSPDRQQTENLVESKEIEPAWTSGRHQELGPPCWRKITTEIITKIASPSRQARSVFRWAQLKTDNRCRLEGSFSSGTKDSRWSIIFQQAGWTAAVSRKQLIAVGKRASEIRLLVCSRRWRKTFFAIRRNWIDSWWWTPWSLGTRHRGMTATSAMTVAEPWIRTTQAPLVWCLDRRMLQVRARYDNYMFSR